MLLVMDVGSSEDRLMHRAWLLVRRWDWVVDRWRMWEGLRALLRGEEERGGGARRGGGGPLGRRPPRVVVYGDEDGGGDER